MRNDRIIYPDCIGIVLRRTRADERGPDVLVTLIDKEDLGRAQEFPNTWCAQWSTDTRSFYARGNLLCADGKRRPILFHRWLLGLEPHDRRQADHIQHNTLDNRRASLRVVTDRENKQNYKRKREMSSRYPGVSWHKDKKKWQAQIQIDGRVRCLGRFQYEESAAFAYNRACANLKLEATQYEGRLQ